MTVHFAPTHKSRTRADATKAMTSRRPQVGSPAHRGQRCRPPIGGTKGMTINSWTYGLIYLSAILWRVVKAANRIVLFFLGLIVLIQVVSALNGPEGGGVLDDTLMLMPASSMPS